MIEADKPANEAKRLASVQRLRLLGDKPERLWQHLAELASAVCDTPIALVTAVGEDVQMFKGNVGLKVDRTGREESFCSHAIADNAFLQVPDASKDERFHDNPLVVGYPEIRFYAGAPIKLPDGGTMGTVCVIDREPRELTENQERSLQLLARHGEELLQVRDLAIELDDALASAEGTELRDAVNKLSHELGTPLTPILARLHLLGKSIADDEGKKHLESIQSNVKRMVDSLQGIRAKLLEELS